MGPLLVHVSPYFREKIVVTCKIGSFVCRLDNLLQENVIVFFFENQISRWRSFEKRGYFWPTFHMFYTPGKSYTNSFSTYLTHIHVFCSPYCTQCVATELSTRIYLSVHGLFTGSGGIEKSHSCKWAKWIQWHALPLIQQSTQQWNKGYYPNLHGWDFSIPPLPFYVTLAKNEVLPVFVDFN